MSSLSNALDVAYVHIRKTYGIEPFSQEFLFSDRCAEGRNSRIVGRDGGRSLLSWMLREPMSAKVRKRLFPGVFDLGNCLDVPADSCDSHHLAAEIMDEMGAEAGESIRTIRKGIFAITGRKVTDYKDRSTVLKVIKTLFKVMRLRDQDRIFGLISAPNPPGKAHFEFRDAFPHSRNTKNTWIVADLKAYLGAEIQKQRLDRIDRLFGTLIKRVEHARENTERCAYSKKDYIRSVEACETLRKWIDSFQAPHVKSRASLDEDLYVHLSRVEFLNFAGELLVVLDAARPPEPIAAMVPELKKISHSIEQRIGHRLALHTEFLILSTFTAFAKEFADEFRCMVSTATGVQIDDSTYHKCLPYAEELLFRVNFLGRGTSPLRNEIWVSIRSIAAALCAVLQEWSNRSRFRPRWFGYTYQGGSLINALSTKVFDGDGQGTADMPEVFLQVWGYRLQWVQDALCNHLELAEGKLALRRLVITKFSDCVTVGTVDSINDALNAFDQHVSAACAQLTD